MVNFDYTGEDQKLFELISRIKDYIKAPQVCTPSEWVEQNLFFPDGPMAGQPMKLDNFQKGMIDAINEDKIKIVFMTSAQIGKTTVLNGMLFYKSAIEGGNAGVAQATGGETDNWLKGKIIPMIESSPAMQDIVVERNARDSSFNSKRIDLKSGGIWYMMSLNNPTHLRGKTLPLILMDEVEAVEDSDEGSPISLAQKRATTFQDEARIVVCSTPNTKYGPINKEFLASDQRFYMVDCPHCGHSHRITFKDCIKFDMIKENGKEIPDSETAVQICPECSETITDIQRARMIHNGKWVAHNPGSSSIGFHISALYSPRASVKQIVEDYKDHRARFDVKSFYNTVLGEVWNDGNEDIETHVIDTLRQPIGLDSIPDDVLFLTAGVDQQKDRLECTVMGHAPNKLYILSHRSFHGQNLELHGDPAYTALYKFLKLRFTTESGRILTMARCNIDSGNGRATKIVYAFAQKWNNIKAIKGASKVDAPLIPPKSSTSGGYELWLLGVNEGKNKIREILVQNINDTEDPVIELILSDDLPDDYADQLMAEEVKKVGQARRWVPRQGAGRNEALDTFCYGLAARFQVQNMNQWDYWFKVKSKAEQNLEKRLTRDEIEESTETDNKYEHGVNVVEPKVEKAKPRQRQRPPQRPRTQRRF